MDEACGVRTCIARIVYRKCFAPTRVAAAKLMRHTQYPLESCGRREGLAYLRLHLAASTSLRSDRNNGESTIGAGPGGRGQS